MRQNRAYYRGKSLCHKRAVGAVLVGVVFNNEKVNLEKALFLSLIIFSVVMLKKV
ncbi:MAG: hypothetical protein ACTTIV_04960 [Campylobacter sp.]